MSTFQELKASFRRRLLTVANSHLLGPLETSLTGYEEEIGRRRRLLDLLRRTGDQQLVVNTGPPRKRSRLEEEEEEEQQEEPSHIKEEQQEEEPQIKEEQEEAYVTELLPFSCVPVKSKDDEDEAQSSQLHHRDSVGGRSCGGLDPGDSSETDVSDGGWEESSEAQSDSDLAVVPVSCSSSKKSFVCPECGRRFGRKGNLETHLRTHTGERPFSCHLCHKTFTTNLILKMHMSVHTGDKRFECGVCGRKFSWHSQVKQHKCVRDQDLDLGPEPPWLRRHLDPDIEDRTEDS